MTSFARTKLDVSWSAREGLGNFNCHYEGLHSTFFRAVRRCLILDEYGSDTFQRAQNDEIGTHLTNASRTGSSSCGNMLRYNLESRSRRVVIERLVTTVNRATCTSFESCHRIISPRQLSAAEVEAIHVSLLEIVQHLAINKSARRFGLPHLFAQM